MDSMNRNRSTERGRNLVECASVYRDGKQWVIAETGQAHQAVRIGTGDTLREAYDSMQATPMQSVGPDSGLADALRWAAHAGWISDPDGLEEVEDADLRDEI